jgi:hypothetical protein
MHAVAPSNKETCCVSALNQPIDKNVRVLFKVHYPIVGRYEIT